MANIHINRDRQSLGHFSPEEVAAGLASGRFLASDLAWTEGMESWKPLGEFPGLPTVEVEAPITAPGAPLVAPPTETEPAWERRTELGLVAATVESVKSILSKPVATFESLKTTGGLLSPLSFYLLLSWATGGVAVLYQLGMALVNPESMGDELKGLSSGVIIAIYLAVIAIALPVLLAIAAFVSPGLVHLSLMLVGGAKKPFETTFRVWTYANGATAIFQLVPFCGGMIAGLYGLIICVIGLQKAHDISLGRAIAAVLLPFVICCGGMFLLVIALGGTEFWSILSTELAKQKQP